MEAKIFYIAIAAFIAISVSKAHGDLRDIGTQPVRVERSIKDAFSKDNSPETPAITRLRHKVFSLEDSMGKINGEIDGLSKQNAELQDSMLEQQNLMQTIATEFAGLQTQLSTHAEQLSDFEKMNHTCGGVLVGQAGSIVFSSRSYWSRNQFGCVWTIRANNQEFIKVSTHPPTAYSIISYVMEIVKPNGTQSYDSSSQLPQIKITPLQKNMVHIFTGPTIFVVAPMVHMSDIDLYLQFEGKGKLVDKDTAFTHKSLLSNLTYFSNNELETWNSSLREQSDSKVNHTFDYTTITVSNFSTKAHLQAAIGNGGCSNGASFIVITQIMATAVSQCGGVLGGVSGTISYKSNINYRNNERCIWAIVPQPVPKSSIVISVNSFGITDTDDHLYLMQLTDVYGEDLPNAPNITKLRKYVTYTPRSREVYIVFYSDFAISGDGFSLTWRVAGDLIKTGSEVATQFTHFIGDNGSATSLSRKSSYTNSFYQVFIFTPPVPTSYTEGLQLELNQTLPVVGASECTPWNISVYNPVNGLLAPDTSDLFYSRASFAKMESCSNSREVVLKKADGMVVVVLKAKNASSEIALDFKWSLEPDKENITEVILADNKCGGVIVANKGAINYKYGTTYSTNERCIWLLNTPKSTNVSFKLVGNGLADSYSSSTYIMVTPIDPEEGKLRNDTALITRTTKSTTVQASMMVVMFRSFSSTPGYGFSLQFVSRGYESDSNYSYNLRHVSDFNGTIEYDDDDEGTKDIFVLGSSVAHSTSLAPISVNWKGGVFRKAKDSCNFDTVTFYTPLSYHSGGWVAQARMPNPKVGSCPDVLSVTDKSDMFTSDAPVFLAIYKPVSNPETQLNVTEKRFRFDYKALVMVTTCGGTIRADSGRISYKENDRYYNSERCVWDIETPQASMISFYLEKTGLEECCDLITVYPEGSLTNGVRLT
ncbi:unnamed protein product [Orchesella dallaii]|uniref:CUB domain-containing protein n=1 Tax=Orchesella dallaii TaxID=48710 RepID=A0ABP1PM71_9HEXA